MQSRQVIKGKNCAVCQKMQREYWNMIKSRYSGEKRRDEEIKNR